MAFTLDDDVRIPVSLISRLKTGNIITPGLNIDGNSTYDVSLTTWINYNIDQGRIDVTGSSLGAVVTVDGTQTITGNKTFSGAVAMNGGLTMDTNKFTVADTTGNTVVGGTLTVTGATALDGGLTMDTNKFIVADTSGNVTMAGTVLASNASVTLSAVPTYADDATAGAGGLTAGRVYQTATGELRIKL